MAILPVEQDVDSARALAGDISAVDRGEVVLAGPAKSLTPEQVRKHLMVRAAAPV